ncbi:MAG: ABC transporter ATP-binding protein [Gammaproteobacteria bacterium]|nr:ABC transporter ATP-binding protein [Gammaproteobacteria bacterium]
MILLQGISKLYQTPEGNTLALKKIDLTINASEFLAITGPSGSGKSTLLAILGCLDKPSAGQYFFNNKLVDMSDDVRLAKLRNRHIGFVFQQFNLISRFSALANVELPMIYAEQNKEIRTRKARIALQAVGLGDRMTHKPSELSGGQQQRVAIARALVNNPDIIFADEPTGALDEATAHEVMTLFRQLHEAGKTIVFITHDKKLLPYASRVIRLENGQITGELQR